MDCDWCFIVSETGDIIYNDYETYLDSSSRLPYTIVEFIKNKFVIDLEIVIFDVDVEYFEEELGLHSFRNIVDHFISQIKESPDNFNNLIESIKNDTIYQ